MGGTDRKPCNRATGEQLVKRPLRIPRAARLLKMQKRKQKKWVAQVKTDSTHPPAGLFKKSAHAIAKSLASKRISPKGPGSGMRMLTYFINRAGRGLDAKRRAELEKAKLLLSKRVQHEKSANKKKAA